MYSKWVNAMMIHFCFPRVSKVHNYAGYCVVSADIYLPGTSCKSLCYYCVWCETKGSVFKQMEVACLNKAVLLELSPECWRMRRQTKLHPTAFYSVLLNGKSPGSWCCQNKWAFALPVTIHFIKVRFCAKLCEISFAIIVKIVFGSQVA